MRGGVAVVGMMLLASTVLVAPVAGQRDRAQKILAAAAERYAGIRSLCADFEQHLSVPMLQENRRGRGRLCEERPNLFAMRFTEPKGDEIVADGKSVWVYYRSADPKQVIETPMSDADGGFDFQREFLRDPGARYTASYVGTDTVAGHLCHRLHLVPRTETSYRSADVWIDDGVPVLRRVRVEEENGSVRTVTLLHIRTNLRIDPSWFTFKLPPGAQVIRR